MSRRDKLVISGIVALAVLGIGWVKFVSPERAKVTTLNSKVETAHQQLQSAQSELSSARSAQARYAEAYASIVKLGKAVPAQQEVPTLVYEVDQASNNKHVEFTSITSGASGSSASSSSSSSSAAKGAAAPTGFTPMPFTFIFNGSFSDLYELMNSLQGLDIYSPATGVNVRGRLLSIQSINLLPEAETATSTGAAGSAHKHVTPGEHLTGTITATAYVLPPGQSLPNETPSSSSGSGSPSSSGSGSSSTTTAPATIKALP